MLDAMTFREIVAEIKMIRTAFKGSILVVEGSDDARFFKRFIDAEKCTVIPAMGKSNVIGAVSRTTQDRFQGVLGIVDADFLHLLSRKRISDNIALTDYHDIEIMILESNALTNTLEELGSSKKIRKLIQTLQANSIRDVLYEAAWPLGILRLVSEKRKLSLSFEGLKYKKILAKDNLAVNINKLIQTTLQMSDCDLSQTNLRELYDQERSEQIKSDRRQICCGHDVVAIMSFGLRNTIGSLKYRTADERMLGKVLRLSYDSDYLKQTALYGQIKSWETRNTPFVVLAI